jgi:stress response protein YsnF
VTHTVFAVFDSLREAEQAAHHLALDVGGVRGEVYDARRESEITVLGLPAEDGDAMREAIRRGGAVLHASVPEEEYDAVVGVLERDGAVNIDERAASWRQEGWTGGATATEAVGDVGMTPGAVAQASAAQATAAQTTGAGAQASPHDDIFAAGRTEATGRTESIPVVEERVSVGKRQAAGGSVRVRSYVVETPVEESVTLREERVQVERRPVDRPIQPGDDAFRDRTIEATETREEAVVSKEARVTGEVVVNKTAGERTETVRDTVRRTEVEVEDETGRTGAPEQRRDRT